jgi:hypothetical protein
VVGSLIIGNYFEGSYLGLIGSIPVFACREIYEKKTKN